MTTQMPGAGVPAAPPAGSPLDFANTLLADLGVAHPTANQDQTVVDWAAAEGGNWHNTAWYNPLNTTLRMGATANDPASHVLSGGGPAAAAGVQAYNSWGQGLDATLSTILEPRYRSIVADLRGNAPETQTAADIAASPWGTPNFKPGIGGAGTGTGGGPGATTAGLNLNPFDGFGVLSQGAQDIGSGIAAGAGTLIKDLTAPLKSFIENGFLVVFGLIIIVVGLVLLAHAAVSGSSNTAAGSAAGAAAGSSFGTARANRRASSSTASSSSSGSSSGPTWVQEPRRKAIGSGGHSAIEDAEIIE